VTVMSPTWAPKHTAAHDGVNSCKESQFLQFQESIDDSRASIPHLAGAKLTPSSRRHPFFAFSRLAWQDRDERHRTDAPEQKIAARPLRSDHRMANSRRSAARPAPVSNG
jgi:hypothetical protein